MKLLTHTPTLLAGLFALGLMNIGAAHAAEQQHSYSNSGYCQLAAKGTSHISAMYWLLMPANWVMRLANVNAAACNNNAL